MTDTSLSTSDSSYTPTTEEVFNRLPAYIREADSAGQLKTWISLFGDQLDEVMRKIGAIAFYPLDDRGEPGDTSALVDATQAGTLGDPVKHLAWLAQLLGVRLNTADSLEAQIDAVRYASSGWKAGTKEGLANAARSVLSGTKYVLIENHYAGDEWAINIRTRASETPDSTTVVNAILAKRAKPAGYVLLNVNFSTSWDVLEAERPTWDDWDGSTWVEIEETGAPSADPGDIPDPEEQPTTGDFEPPKILGFVPTHLTPDFVGPNLSFGVPRDTNFATLDISIVDSAGDPVSFIGSAGSPEQGDIPYVIQPDPGPFWLPGETYTVTIEGHLADDSGNVMGSDVVRTFTTLDVPAHPDVQGVVPMAGATAVDVTTSIVLTMNTLLDSATVIAGNFYVEKAISGALFATTINESVDPSVGYGNTIVELTFDTPPDPGTLYRVVVKGDGVSGVQDDVSGAYMQQDFTSTFTTAGTAPVTSTATVVSTNPANNQQNAATNLEIAVRFNRPMNGATFTPSTVIVREVGTLINLTASVSYNSSQFRISVPTTTPLKNSKNYEVVLGTGIKDTDGANFAGYTYKWTTVSSTGSTLPGSGIIEPNWTETYFNDFKAPLDFVNDWWPAYNGPSTSRAGSWRPSQVQVDTSGTGKLRLIGVKDATKKFVSTDPNKSAKSDLITGAVALGRKSLPEGSFFEVRSRMDKGNGFGKAVLTWPDGDHWPDDGEDDIIEVPKGDRLSGSSNYHYKNTAGAHASVGHSYPDAITGPIDFSQWHIFRVEWMSNRRTYFVDGKKTFEITDPAKLEHAAKMHLCLQGECATPGFWVTPWDSTTPSQVVMEVDWVRQGRYTGP